MRKNEFNSLEDFTSQYTGVWAPSEGHWFGLDFSYNGIEYRFNTGSMYEEKKTSFDTIWVSKEVFAISGSLWAAKLFSFHSHTIFYWYLN